MGALSQPSKLQKKAKVFTGLVVEQIAQLERDYGGRAGVVAVLSMAKLSEDLEYFLGQLGDPRNAGVSLAELCARSHILPGQLLQLLLSAGQLYAKARTAHQVHLGLSPVVADLLRRAAPYEEDCTECMVEGRPQGTVVPEPTPQNQNPAPIPCPTCKGALRLRYLPDLTRQELVLDLAQVLPKGGGMQINMQQNNLGEGGGGSHRALDAVQKLAEQALYGAGPLEVPDALEAEVDPPAEDPPG